MDDVRRATPRHRVLTVVLGVLTVIVVLPIGVVAWMLFHTDRWEADVAALVDEVHGSYYGVGLTADLPPDAMASGPTGGLVFEEPGDLRPGDAVVCRVVQTYTMNTDLDSGPQTDIESCRS